MLLINIPQTLTTKPLPNPMTATSLRLPKSDHATLLKKHSWLEKYTVVLPRRITHDPSLATFVFAQEEAGTAVCISPNGVLLTCSHCVAETKDDLDWKKTHWLLFGKGSVVGARTVAWDNKRDLALLVITTTGSAVPYPYLTISSTPPVLKSQLICIGHPGSEDLETSTPGIQTNYDTLVLSTGHYHGLAEDQDAQDNSEIGALKHSCWTYWGHSGAPLVERRGPGRLVGVHSSWDDETGMRRGVGWEALTGFLEKFKRKVGQGEEGWVWWVGE